jgi:gamma-glutamyl phosphate reductase
VRSLLQDGPANVVPVKAEQYDDEFLSLDLNVKIVAISTTRLRTSVSMARSILTRS